MPIELCRRVWTSKLPTHSARFARLPAGYSSTVLHPLIRLLDGAPSDELRERALDTLCSVALAVGPDFAIFLPTIKKVGVPRAAGTCSMAKPELVHLTKAGQVVAGAVQPAHHPHNTRN